MQISFTNILHDKNKESLLFFNFYVLYFEFYTTV